MKPVEPIEVFWEECKQATFGRAFWVAVSHPKWHDTELFWLRDLCQRPYATKRAVRRAIRRVVKYLRQARFVRGWTPDMDLPPGYPSVIVYTEFISGRRYYGIAVKDGKSLVFFDAYSPLDGRISFNRRDVAERHAEALAEALRKAQEREWENR